MHKLLYILLFTIACGNCILLMGQTDSFAFEQQALKAEHLQLEVSDFKSQEIVATGQLTNVEDLPYTIHIITKEEILQKGYYTLVDAMKSVPGVRVSQPGSAHEGETFLIRGLRGNQYAQIYINNVPVKPLAEATLPIGAQFPIRQAERIEVIMGTGGLIGGVDAAAAVINIVIKETERPLYSKVDIGFGTGRYVNLNIIFGGKIGYDNRNLFRYNVFGSFVALDNQVFSQDLAESNILEPNLYAKDGLYLSNPNYRFGNFMNFFPLINKQPSEHRLMGANVQFRNLKFTFSSMQRKEHSALGLNPVATSYANPLNYIGEVILQGDLSYRLKRDKYTLKCSLSLLNVTSDVNSSYRIVENQFAKAAKVVAAADDDNILIPLYEDRVSTYWGNFLLGDRFFYNYSTTGIGSVQYAQNLLPYLSVDAGINYHATVLGAEYFSDSPYPNLLSDVTQDDPSQVHTYTEIFGGLQLKLTKWKGYAAIKASKIRNGNWLVAPRAGMVYKILPVLSARAYWGKSYRLSTPRLNTGAFTIQKGNYEYVYTGRQLGTSVGIDLPGLEAEEVRNIETGLRWYPYVDIYIDLSYFNTNTSNLVSYQQIKTNDSAGDLLFYTIGHFNDEDLSIKLSGVQLATKWHKEKFSTWLNTTYTQGQTRVGDQLNDYIVEQPNLIIQGGVSATMVKDMTWGANINYISKWRTQTNIEEISEGYAIAPAVRENGGIYFPATMSFDLLAEYNITDLFHSRLEIKNIFNRALGGLAATGSSDDLVWNIQNGRQWRIIFSYRME